MPRMDAIFTETGAPRHPLYVRAEAPLLPYDPTG